MTSMLPPTRDLPPGRQARIRAEIERAATRRGSRRLAVPILAAAAAVAVVTAGIVVFRPLPTLPVPAVQITTSPATPSADFGIPREEVAAIEKGCAESAGSKPPKLRQLLNDQTRWAVLYSEKEGLVCSIGVGGVAYNSAFGQTAVQWLPGHFSIDYQGARSGGAMDGRPESANVPGNRTSVGRVDDKVARVTFTVDDQTVEAKVANGTYAARIYYPPNWGIPNAPTNEVVRAYDAEGTLLGVSSDLERACYLDPRTGEVVFGDRRTPKADCLPAQPWR
ncbi:hypothetical protein SAMN04488564_1148 [Lentzea waywayandensis]|uniref:Uncharacterized protein n=1 Tax=Lentzea waywayandensis TaxID=84724 RepID=A0A1I6FF92_9PSEU|nr:hypothetical protein [Lentzea waywayandensis]SFR28447.1 hypothetical protein SAMN04488564_1148 [Lentzea waywayandensis]